MRTVRIFRSALLALDCALQCTNCPFKFCSLAAQSECKI
jgi:hypothetical protein